MSESRLPKLTFTQRLCYYMFGMRWIAVEGRGEPFEIWGPYFKGRAKIQSRVVQVLSGEDCRVERISLPPLKVSRVGVEIIFGVISAILSLVTMTQRGVIPASLFNLALSFHLMVVLWSLFILPRIRAIWSQDV